MGRVKWLQEHETSFFIIIIISRRRGWRRKARRRRKRRRRYCFVGTGSLVKNFFPKCERKVHLITSEKVIPSKNLSGYFLCFKDLKDKDKEPVNLASLSDESEVFFKSGLTFVPVFPDRLGIIRKSLSGLIYHRPFSVCDKGREDLSSRELCCQVVEESGKSFVIRPYQVKGIVGERPYLTDLTSV